MKFKCLLIICFAALCLGSCKKDAPAPTDGALILGKWYTTKQVSVLYHNGTELSTISQTNFTNDDFVEYYDDGSGYYSRATSQGPSLSEFTYSINGANITEYLSAVNTGITESIQSVSSSGLAIHAVSMVPDPNDPTVTDTEIDDFTYSR